VPSAQQDTPSGSPRTHNSRPVQSSTRRDRWHSPETLPTRGSLLRCDAPPRRAGGDGCSRRGGAHWHRLDRTSVPAVGRLPSLARPRSGKGRNQCYDQRPIAMPTRASYSSGRVGRQTRSTLHDQLTVIAPNPSPSLMPTNGTGPCRGRLETGSKPQPACAAAIRATRHGISTQIRRAPARVSAGQGFLLGTVGHIRKRAHQSQRVRGSSP